MNEPTNVNGKIFNLVRPEPDLTTLILGARDEVVEDNSLSIGARLMFVRILDLSVRQASNVRPGVVTISQTKLAEKFGVSLRTIWNWKTELVTARVIWMSSQPMPNAWPIDTYHVSAVHPPHNSGDKTSVEGLWGNGARQRRPEHVGMGARQPGQRQIPGTGVRSNRLRVANSFQPPSKSSILPTNATPRRSGLPASVATGCGGEPKQVASHRRKDLRRGAETGCEPPPKQVAAGHRKSLRATAETDCEHIKAEVAGSSHFEGGKDTTPPPTEVEKAFRTWESGLDKQFPRELEKLQNLLRVQMGSVKTDAAREMVRRKLAAVNLRLMGPTVEEPKPVRSPAPSKLVAPKAKPMSPEEIKARWAAEKTKLAKLGLARA